MLVPVIKSEVFFTCFIATIEVESPVKADPSKAYRKLNWKAIAKKMIPPAWVFDSRSIINTDEVKQAGLSLWRLGDGLGD